MATRPQTWVEWADFFSKSLIAAAGLLVSIATLVLTQAEKLRAEAQQRQAHAEKLLADRQDAVLKAKDKAQIQENSDRDGILSILSQLPPDLREAIGLPALRITATTR